MLKHTITASILLASLATGVPAQEPKLESDQDKASYLIGRNIGETINRDGIKLNIENLVIGLREGLAGKDSKISEADAVKIMETFQAEMQKQAEAKACLLYTSPSPRD